MKKLLIFFLFLLFCWTGSAFGVTMYVDTAPNVYGSPNWIPWWDATKADVANGTFVNMRSGIYPGTLDAFPNEEIVYSTGDLGQRLHWVYWLPDTTISELDGLVEVKTVIDWVGTDWTLDENNDWALDNPDVGWEQPTKWEEYNGGVIGTIGWAWWAVDDNALPFDTGGSPYDETDQADIAALSSDLLAAQTHATGLIRYKDAVDGDWVTTSLKVNIVPEPATMILFGFGLLSFVGVSRRKE